MTFLIDENLSARLKAGLASVFPNAIHVGDVGLIRADDAVIWERAKAEGLALLSKDDDLRLIVEAEGPPPKLVWIRLGNASTSEIVEAILASAGEIKAFLAESEEGVLVIEP